MVIVTKRTGQLGNRLFLFAHFVANAAEHRYALANPSFRAYAPYFEATSTQDFGGLPIRLQVFRRARFDYVFQLVQHSRIFRVLQKAVQLLPRRLAAAALLADEDGPDFDLNQPEYLTPARQGLVLAHGWMFRDKTHLRRHAPLIRQLFAPVAVHRRAVEQLIGLCRQQCAVLVGVHMRRGDYATFAHGAFYYDNATYAARMREVQAQFPATTRVAFLLCSNEAFDARDFAGLVLHRATGHFVEDLYALAACDYVLGPPSSYSMWASFYGGVPLCHLHHPDQRLTLNDFQVFLDT
ncbi:hypothetical protein GCM10022408_02270 [Hymenobacter fastidiosus]|uniref:Alpha-1,2-fucosyltransferase n=1 Tax=Hymenobacter fastidiosus TaxID=486264 RepID=A0ABP7RCE4_9BACT